MQVVGKIARDIRKVRIIYIFSISSKYNLWNIILRLLMQQCRGCNASTTLQSVYVEEIR